MDYQNLPEVPKSYSSATVLLRLTDAIGYRFYWSTEDFNQDFRPEKGAMSHYELLEHIFKLMCWVGKSLKISTNDLEPNRQGILDCISRLRDRFLDLKDSELETIQIGDLPFWYAINGPMADALTHIGQLNTYRRLAGVAAPKRNHFKGE